MVKMGEKMVKMACFLGENTRKGGKVLKMICFLGQVLKMGEKKLKMACFLGKVLKIGWICGGGTPKTLFRGEKKTHWKWVR